MSWRSGTEGRTSTTNEQKLRLAGVIFRVISKCWDVL